MPVVMSNPSSQPYIGVAGVDITPPVGVTMVGYTARRSTAVAHPLSARALVCKGSDGAWALLTSDTIGYSHAYARGVRAAIAQAVGVPVDAVVLSGTHTHSGPPTI